MLRETGFVLLVILCWHRTSAACGYESCPTVDQEKLNIHIVAHSHDELGGPKTVDQDYYGVRNDVQNAGVQYILDTVVDALVNDADRKFIYVEVAYFWKWWSEQDEAKQLKVKTLVENGQLVFTGGGWSINDEATTHYYSIIDQLSWGIKRLSDIFGACARPTVAWQIDTYGHSREVASIFAEMGYDGLILGRIDYNDHANRLATKTAELVWQGSPAFGETADIFTMVLPDGYDSPADFCFDIVNCEYAAIIDDPDSPDYNVELKVNEFLRYAYAQAEYYNSNNIMVAMGGNFYYQEALSSFKNLDKLIKYVNAANDSVNVMYSTPACFLKAVNEAGLTFTTKSDDFFPYVTDEHSYWTGFYTSRPTHKYFEKLGNNLLQVSKQLTSITDRVRTGTVTNGSGRDRLEKAREGMGVMQHHQAITGTVKQNIADDYMRLMTTTLEQARIPAETSLNEVISLNDYVASQMRSCLELNVSKCSYSESDQFVVVVYNPLSQTVNHTVRVPVPVGTYLVLDSNAESQPHQFLPIPNSVLVLSEREGSASTYDLVFRAVDLPPLSLRTYYIKRISSSFVPIFPTTEITIGSDTIQVNLNEDTGFIKSIVSNGEEYPLDQKFYYYESYEGDNDGTNRSSGVHVFRPAGQEPILIDESAYFEVYKGDIVDEIHQEINTWVRQIIRVYKDENNVEFEWLVGPIPVDDGIGKEVITRFTTNLETNGVFYTDLNGRQLMERTRNTESSEPVASNYYPVTSTIVIRDTTAAQELAVLTDRSQGGSSLNDGQIELMIHRRLLSDDGIGGIGEALNELEYNSGVVVRGKHYVMIGSTTGSSPSFAAQRRQTAARKILAPWHFMTGTSIDFNSWNNVHTWEFTGMNQDLPSNVVIHTLEPWTDGGGSLLLRLEHILEPDDDTELSVPVEVDITDIFTSFTVTSATQTTLDGNMALADLNRLSWNTESSSTRPGLTRAAMTVSPMEIATYVIEISKRP